MGDSKLLREIPDERKVGPLGKKSLYRNFDEAYRRRVVTFKCLRTLRDKINGLDV